MRGIHAVLVSVIGPEGSLFSTIYSRWDAVAACIVQSVTYTNTGVLSLFQNPDPYINSNPRVTPSSIFDTAVVSSTWTPTNLSTDLL